MATLKQKRLAKAIMEDVKDDTNRTEGKLLEIAGYSGVTAKATPGLIISQKGVQEELKKAGFSLNEADNVVGFILKNGITERSRLDAADKIYKRLGGYAPEKAVNATMSLVDILEQAEEIREHR